MASYIYQCGFYKPSMANFSVLVSLEDGLYFYNYLSVWQMAGWTNSRPAVGEIKNKANLSPAKMS